ncbi:MAG: SOS response-associated peptidase [Pseudomonadales bacterium]|nr:SOS response-associated peptidase [Pseudomonadales bacterium]
MCGRFNITDSPLVHALLEDLGIDIGPLPTRYNILPTEQVPILVNRRGEYKLVESRWGMVPHQAPEPLKGYPTWNAKFEEVQNKPTFSHAYQQRQACVFIVSSWYESDPVKKKETKKAYPNLIVPTEGAYFVAGLWEYSPRCKIVSSTMFTLAPHPDFRAIHSRGLVSLKPDEIAQYLDQTFPWEEMGYLNTPRITSDLDVIPVAKEVYKIKDRPQDSKRCTTPIGNGFTVKKTED